MKKQGFTAFDIDGTIWPLDIENMWLQQLAADGKAPDRIIEGNQQFLKTHAEGKFDENGYLDFFLNHFRGWNIARLRDFSDTVFQKVAKPGFYQEDLSIIKQMKIKGEFIFLLTAANNIAAAPFGKYLGVDAVIATELEFDSNGQFTGKIIEPYCYRQGKIIKSRDLCAKHGFSLEEGTYFGDSISDIPMLECVNRAIVINPVVELEEYARARKWEIMYWND